MSNYKSWQEMTVEERNVIYNQALSEHQRQLFALVDKWNANGVLLSPKNPSRIKDEFLDPRSCEVTATIRTTMGAIKVYLKSESHICTPLQMDLYAIKYTSMAEYARNYPPGYGSLEYFIATISRDIKAVLTFIGVDYKIFKRGKKYIITESVKELYDYLYAFKQNLDSGLSTYSLKDITLKKASRIYNLLVNAFNSVPPLKDRHNPFRADGLLDIDEQEVNRRYDMLSNFCKETNIQPHKW